MSERNRPEQCPECQQMDGEHEEGCKIKAAWDAVCPSMSLGEVCHRINMNNINRKPDEWKQLK